MKFRNAGSVVRALLLAVLMLPVGAMAQHRDGGGHGGGDGHRGGRGHGGGDGHRGGRGGGRQWVPEFDAAAAGVVAALVAGGGILIARRKRR